MTENELRKFLKEQDAVYKKVEDVLRARGVDIISVDHIEQCGTSDVKVSFAFHWDTVAESDCMVIPILDFVEPENQEKTTMAEEKKKTTLLDYTDPEKFFNDYIQDNHRVVSDLSEEEFKTLERNKDFLLEQSKKIYILSNKPGWECVKTVCELLVASLHQASAEEVAKQFGFNFVDGLVCKDETFKEIVDRIGVYMRSGVPPKDAVCLMLGDYANGRIFTADLNLWLKFWSIKRIIDLHKTKENNNGKHL